MDERIVTEARESMESLLNGLVRVNYKVSIFEPMNYCALPKNDPRIVGVGGNTLTIQLGNFRGVDLVAKVVDYVNDHPDYYLLIGNHVGETPETLEKTVDSLRVMGFYVPDNQQFGVESLPREIWPRYYHLAADLREGGKYEIYEINKFPFRKVKNKGLRKLLDESVKKIRERAKSEGYVIEVFRHGTTEKPQQALRRMFFGRINKVTGTGDLVFGDLDHVAIYPKSIPTH